jgi:hypothetical protein
MHNIVGFLGVWVIVAGVFMFFFGGPALPVVILGMAMVYFAGRRARRR